jgi:tetratricopeptide (TPR) repeat protein
MKHNLECSTIVALAILALASTFSIGDDGPDSNLRLKAFSADRHTLANRLATELDIPTPEGMKPFFEAAEEGDWLSVSNRFKAFLKTDEPRDGVRLEIHNELWSPVLETLGIYEVVEGWKRDSSLLAMFHEPIMTSIPTNSIYLGGTDCGRFVITTVNAVRPKPSFYCITQNALADNAYMAYLRAVYGKELWIPEMKDSAKAFQQYVMDIQQGRRPKNAGITIEKGRVQVSGVLGVMEINGILCKMLFDHNKAKHEFFVEESYVIEWMYPYLEPHGLIMKIAKARIHTLPKQTIQRDMEFWKDITESLLNHPGFKSSPDAQNAFAKLRCGIGGIYAFREQYDEADTCFAQAFTLCPYSPEAHFRYAKLHEKRGRIKEAIELMDKYVTMDEDVMKEYVEPRSIYSLENAKKYLVALSNKRPLVPAEKTLLKKRIKELGADDSRIRAAAHKELRAFGVRATPLLMTYVNSEDPEVRLSVNTLVQQIRDAAEQFPAGDRRKAPPEE